MGNEKRQRQQRSPPKPDALKESPPPKVPKGSDRPPVQAGRRRAPTRRAAASPAGGAGSARESTPPADSAARGFDIEEAAFPVLPAASPLERPHVRGELPPSTASPPRATSAQQRAADARANFERTCLPLNITGLNPAAPIFTPSSPPAAMETAEQGGIDDERMPGDGAKSPEQFDDGDGGVPRATGAAGAARGQAAFPKCPAVEQLQRKPPRHRRRKGARGAAEQAAAIAAGLPPAGAVPAEASQAPGGYSSAKPARVTRVVPLASMLKDAAQLPRIRALVLYTSFVIFHVTAILEIYAAQLAAELAGMTPAEREKLLDSITATSGTSKGVVFHRTLVYEVISIVHEIAKKKGKLPKPPATGRTTRGNVDAAPPPLSREKRAAYPYLAKDRVAAEFAACDVPDAAGIDGLRAQAPTIIANAKNQLITTNRWMQRLVVRKLHETSGKEAKKIVLERLGLAAEEQVKLAKEHGAFKARRKAYDARRASEAALLSVTKAQEALDALRDQQRGAHQRIKTAAITAAEEALKAAKEAQGPKLAAFEAAQKELKQWTDTLSDDARDAALMALRTDALPARSRRASATDNDESEDDERPSLLDVLESERAHIPATLMQGDQVLYRAEMLHRLETIGEAKGSLMPRSKPEIKCIAVELPTLELLLDGKQGHGLRRGDNTMNGRLKELLKEEELDKARKGWPLIAPHCSTDGVAWHLALVNEASMAMHLAKQKKQSASIKSHAKGEVAIEVSDDEDEAEHTPDTTLRADADSREFTIIQLPLNAVVTAVDPGRTMVLSAARLGHVSEEELLSDKPLFTPNDVKMKTLGKDRGLVTVSSAAFRHLAGTTQRAADSMRRRRRRLKSDKEFAAAEKLLQDNDISTADVTKLLPALQARGSVFHTMAKDGFRHAHARLDAKYAKRRLLHRLAKMLLPAPNYYVTFGSCKQPGTLCNQLELHVRQVWASQVLPDTIERRTSMLDNQHRWVMAHPPKRLVTGKNGRRYIQRIYGLYMSVMQGYNKLWSRDINAPINILVRFWHEYHFGEAPKEFRYSTPKSDLVFSKACFWAYSWLTAKGCFKRNIMAAPSS